MEGSQNKVRYASTGTGPAIESFGPENDVASGAVQQPAERAPPSPPAPSPPPAPAAAVKPPPPVKPVTGPLELSGDDQERLADCGGRDVVVTGDRSAYIIRGACRSLTARGDLLTIQAVMQPGARIAVTGRGSVVSWAIPGAATPRSPSSAGPAAECSAPRRSAAFLSDRAVSFQGVRLKRGSAF